MKFAIFETPWKPKMYFMGRNRSEIIRVIQQRHPRRCRLCSFRDIRLKGSFPGENVIHLNTTFFVFYVIHLAMLH
ncbi:hypothetical protein T07_2735 [Trichinella nelsoni]|uniref:Uncharacterized protein n=1 Tax=Trichinella nelsoni TaxID=6336 RepID=A0A0V0SHD9_9BILA|nr:hypothetical protein T07_2735 [Trichinella nelsoni]